VIAKTGVVSHSLTMRSLVVAAFVLVLAPASARSSPGVVQPMRIQAPPPLSVAPTGVDSNPCTRTKPCAGLNRAYAVAKAGQVIEIAGGTYGHQAIFPSPKESRARVVFRPAAGAEIHFANSVDIRASNIEFDGVTFGHGGDSAWGWSVIISPPNGGGGSYACVDNVVIDGGGGSTFHIQNGVSNVSIKNGTWGNYPSAPGQNSVDSSFGFDKRLRCPDDANKAPPASKILLENNQIGNTYQHCVGQPTSCLAGAHPDCLQWIGYTGSVTVRGNRFDRCYGDVVFAESCTPSKGCAYGESGVWGPVIFENNWFGSVAPGTIWMFSVVDSQETWNTTTTCTGWIIRNNTFAYAASGTLDIRCRPPNGDASQAFQIQGNTFASGPVWEGCRTGAPYFNHWLGNIFQPGGVSSQRC
jgi:hypothetical protein